METLRSAEENIRQNNRRHYSSGVADKSARHSLPGMADFN